MLHILIRQLVNTTQNFPRVWSCPERYLDSLKFLSKSYGNFFVVVLVITFYMACYIPFAHTPLWRHSFFLLKLGYVIYQVPVVGVSLVHGLHTWKYYILVALFNVNFLMKNIMLFLFSYGKKKMWVAAYELSFSLSFHVLIYRHIALCLEMLRQLGICFNFLPSFSVIFSITLVYQGDLIWIVLLNFFRL